MAFCISTKVRYIQRMKLEEQESLMKQTRQTRKNNIFEFQFKY